MRRARAINNEFVQSDECEVMACIEFRSKEFTAEHTAVIDQANRIINRWSEMGLRLTLRQLYYQFIAANVFPNTERSYKRLGGIISDARLAGFLDLCREGKLP